MDAGEWRRRRQIYDAEEPAFERRRRRNAAAKASIAKAAARLVGPNETIALDVGTSTLAVAEELAGRDDLRVFTNNLRAAIALSRGRSQVYVLGGQLRGPEFAIIGPSATAQVRDYYFDRLFLGVSGITETGLYDYMLEDTEVKRAFLERARDTVVLCDDPSSTTEPSPGSAGLIKFMCWLRTKYPRLDPDPQP